MNVIARYMRYHSTYEEEFETVDSAFSFLARGEDRGILSSVSVTDGVTTYTAWP